MAAHWFTVGVPMYVEVAEDGTVTFEVDLTEVDMDEDDEACARYSDEERERIELFVSAACSRLGNHKRFTNPTNPL